MGDENASNSWQWVTYNLDIRKENVYPLGGSPVMF